jgi:hypothetical protein
MTTGAGPVDADAGVVQFMAVLPATTVEVTSVVSIFTVVPWTNPVPATVTGVPPDDAPKLGVIEVNVGAG